MTVEVTNKSKALQGVYAQGKRLYLKPGETRKDLDMTEDELKRAKALKFLDVKSKPAASQSPAKKDETPDDPPPSIEEVLAMYENPEVHSSTSAAAAKKILGDATPTKKDEIIDALKAKLAEQAQ